MGWNTILLNAPCLLPSRRLKIVSIFISVATMPVAPDDAIEHRGIFKALWLAHRQPLDGFERLANDRIMIASLPLSIKVCLSRPRSMICFTAASMPSSSSADRFSQLVLPIVLEKLLGTAMVCPSASRALAQASNDC
jgi:hypothetical protein